MQASADHCCIVPSSSILRPSSATRAGRKTQNLMSNAMIRSRSSQPIAFDRLPGAPVLWLLHPREQTWFAAGTLALGLLFGWFAMVLLGWPLWGATASLLVL